MAKSNNLVNLGSLYADLSIKYEPEQPLLDRRALSIRENGATYRLELSRSVPTATFHIDGVIISSGLKCDDLVLINSVPMSWDLVFVELKGTDVMHAVSQLKASITNSVFYHPTNRKKYARIVAAAFPSNRSDTELERAKIEFKKAYKCDLKKFKYNRPDKILV